MGAATCVSRLHTYRRIGVLRASGGLGSGRTALYDPTDIDVRRTPTLFVRLAPRWAELTIALEALLCGEPWRT
jgi:hypothetical protein